MGEVVRSRAYCKDMEPVKESKNCCGNWDENQRSSGEGRSRS
jgi:hypothetical protein